MVNIWRKIWIQIWGNHPGSFGVMQYLVVFTTGDRYPMFSKVQGLRISAVFASPWNKRGYGSRLANIVYSECTWPLNHTIHCLWPRFGSHWVTGNITKASVSPSENWLCGYLPRTVVIEEMIMKSCHCHFWWILIPLLFPEYLSFWGKT